MHMDAHEMSISGCTSFQMGKPSQESIFEVCPIPRNFASLYARC